jgi:hypothetical protein
MGVRVRKSLRTDCWMQINAVIMADSEAIVAVPVAKGSGITFDFASKTFDIAFFTITDDFL